MIRWSGVLHAIACIAAFIALITNLDIRSAIGILMQVPLILLLGLFASTLIAIQLDGWRLLIQMEVRPGWLRALVFRLKVTFFATVLPFGSFSQDLGLAWVAHGSGYTPRRIAGAVLVLRAASLVAICLQGASGLFLAPGPYRNMAWVAISLATSLICLLAATSLLSPPQAMRSIKAALIRILRRTRLRLLLRHVAEASPRQLAQATLTCLPATLASQAFVVLSAYLASIAASTSLDLWQVAFIGSISAIAGLVLPFGIVGLGVKDLTMLYLLRDFGVDAQAAAGMIAIYNIPSLASALMGGGLALAGIATRESTESK